MNINATILGQLISFVLFTWFCMKYVWFPLMSIIEKRQKEISDNLTNSNNFRIESERIHSEAICCLNQARIQAQDIINKANICRAQILNDAKYEANQERDRILFQTKNQVMLEKIKVIDELRAKIGQFIIESSEKIIEHSINEVIDNNIIDNFIQNFSNQDY